MLPLDYFLLITPRPPHYQWQLVHISRDPDVDPPCRVDLVVGTAHVASYLAFFRRLTTSAAGWMDTIYEYIRLTFLLSDD